MYEFFTEMQEFLVIGNKYLSIYLLLIINREWCYQLSVQSLFKEFFQ